MVYLIRVGTILHKVALPLTMVTFLKFQILEGGVTADTVEPLQKLP